jgi:hypothetical protein
MKGADVSGVSLASDEVLNCTAGMVLAAAA